MPDIFFSYAKEDEAGLRRIYDDLTRLGLKAWEFNRDGEVGVNFEDELRRMIENSRFFCLLDSSRARKSKYIQIECRYAIESKKQRNFPKIVICTMEEGFDWGTAEIFPGQNTERSIDLTVRNYKTGMKKLCDFLEIRYTPRFMIPLDHDFEEELQQIKMHEAGILEQDWQRLMDDYAKFREKHSSHRQFAETLLQRIIFEAEDLGIPLKTPYLALGVMQAESNRHQQAVKTFQTATQIFKEDPRFWAGLGGAQFYLAKYESAVTSYGHCVQLIKNSQNEAFQSHLFEVFHNLEEALCATGEYFQADYLLTKEFEELLEFPQIQAVKGNILYRLGNIPQACQILEQLFFDLYPRIDTFKEQQFFVSAILVLADCYKVQNKVNKEEGLLKYATGKFADDPEIWRRYAIYLWETRQGPAKNPQVIECFQKAIELSNGYIKYRAELALILKATGDEPESREQLAKCFEIEHEPGPITGIENYYLGLAYYLVNKPEIARHRYELSKKDSQLKNWPFYNQLTQK